MVNNKEEFHCYLRVLTPVHISLGREYNPFEYVISRNNPEMLIFSERDFISVLETKQLEKLEKVPDGFAALVENYNIYRNLAETQIDLIPHRRVAIPADFFSYCQRSTPIAKAGFSAKTVDELRGAGGGRRGDGRKDGRKDGRGVRQSDRPNNRQGDRPSERSNDRPGQEDRRGGGRPHGDRHKGGAFNKEMVAPPVLPFDSIYRASIQDDTRPFIPSSFIRDLLRKAIVWRREKERKALKVASKLEAKQRPAQAVVEEVAAPVVEAVVDAVNTTGHSSPDERNTAELISENVSASASEAQVENMAATINTTAGNTTAGEHTPVAALKATEQPTKSKFDPFKALKVTDCKPIGNVSTEIKHALCLVSSGETPEKWFVESSEMAEVIPAGSVFRFSVSLDNGRQAKTDVESTVEGSCGQKSLSPDDVLSRPLSMSEVWEAMSDYFPTAPLRGEQKAKLGELASQLKDGEVSLRLGYYTKHDRQALAQGVVAPLWIAADIEQYRPKHTPHTPFGWVALGQLKGSELRRVENEQSLGDDWFQSDAKEKEDKLFSLLAERHAIRVQAEQEAFERQRAEQERAALSDEEKLICRLGDKDVTEQEIMQAYEHLAKNTFSGEDKQKVALQLKVIFERLNKWSGTQLSKKQKEKNAKIKEVLANV